MQAIVNVSKKSAYAHLNGHTFEVKEVMHSNNSNMPIFGLDIENQTVDFSAKEVIIVALKEHVNWFKYRLNVNGALFKYAEINKIKL